MGQIVKRKKKGRPSKADLARRAAIAEQPLTASTESDVRRSRRRRSVRYTLDYDDFIDEDEEDDVRRREKKLKLLLKLHSKDVGSGESAPSRTRRVEHAPDVSASSSDDEDGGGDNKLLKKRKIDGNNDEVDGDEEDDENVNDLNIDEEEDEVRRRKAGSKRADSAPGTPQDPPLGFPLPDKKSLELILDKLQKKDTYGVYAEPVDPEELPDYHDVIEHPMDFATVRKKLGNGSYSTLEQFESDVFLICTNAMQYNAPDTIYHKQAHSILELATKKFQRLKIGTEHFEKEIKSEQKIQSNSLAKKQIKKPMNRTALEPVGSDFSSGATLAVAGDFQSGSNATQAAGFERLSNVDGPLEGSTSLIDNNLEKAEDLPTGRGLLSRFGRKPFVQDENRRASYNVADLPMSGSESIFKTFDGEIKQLVAVGLHADLTYARSLARFAATLGPVAWKFASKRIEQALPPGFKFGRGWVGDYEPLPTPVLMLENCSPKVPGCLTKLQCTSDKRKDDRTSKAPVSAQEHPDAKKDDRTSKAPVSAQEHPNARKDDRTSKAPFSAQEHPVSVSSSEGKSSLLGGAAATNTTIIPTASAPVLVNEQPVAGVNLERKEPFFCSGGSRVATIAHANYQQQSPRSRNIEPVKKVKKPVELNCPPPSGNQNTRDFVTENQIRNGMVGPNSQSMGTVSWDRSLRRQSVPFKQPDNNGFIAGELPNGKISSNSLDRQRMVTSSSNGMPSQMVAAASNVSHGQEQGLSDPVQLMRMLAENAQKQQKSLNQSPVDNLSVQSSRRDDSSNAAAAAAQAWMSIGAGGSKPALENSTNHKNQIFADSPYNTSRELHQQVSRFQGDLPISGMNVQPVKNSFPFQAFMRPPVQMGNEAQFQDRPMVFPPQLVTAHLSRFQVQSPWQTLSPRRQTNQKQESLPPDLNIGFQSSGSPTGQASGVLMDSQQPDLALQL